MQLLKPTYGKLVSAIAATWEKYEETPWGRRIFEFAVKFNRKSLVARCFLFSATVHMLVMFPNLEFQKPEPPLTAPQTIEIRIGTEAEFTPPTPPVPQQVASIPQQVEPVATPTKALPQPKKQQMKIKPSKPVGSKNGNSVDAAKVAPEDYLELLQYTVQEMSDVPAEAQGLRGVAVLRLKFNRKGYVLSYVLKQSAGSPMLDGAAVNVAKRLMSEPFPAAPEGFDKGDRVLEYDFPIRYPANG